MKSKKIVFIVGPTASGKSDIAYQLTGQIKSQIISCDSVQVYKEINIASNKPSPEILKEIPHHLVNIKSIEQTFDVSQFNQLAQRAIEEIHKKRELPLVVGGSGLYMNILLDGIFEGARPDLQLRDQLWAQSEELGADFLHGRPNELDPKTAQAIHPNDVKKVIRALEIYHQEKKPFSKIKGARHGIWGQYEIYLFALAWPRNILYERINERTEEMFKRGLIDEIKNLGGLKLSPSAAGIIGIKEVLGFLNNEYDLEQTKYLMKLNTRHFAKRQLTWFRKEKRLCWIELDYDKTNNAIVKQIQKEAKL